MQTEREDFKSERRLKILILQLLIKLVKLNSKRISED